MRTLADDDNLALPIMSHPAFQGGLVSRANSGLSHRVLYGRLNRLAGADATIFPSYGGRFAYSPEQCRDIIVGATGPMGSLRAIVPVPAGGMRLDRIDELVRFYGRDCMLLIGGDLHAQGKDLIQTCQDFEALATRPPLSPAT
jgi:ribulose-bisphosphate carboxylase large chain